MFVEIIVPCGMVTMKSTAWGAMGKELFKASQEAIRYAVQRSEEVNTLREWLETRTKLEISVEFHLKKQRAHHPDTHHSDLDSLLSDLFNPLVEGACGPRAAGKPIPQTKDALFWQASIAKVEDEDEKTIIRIKPL